MTKLSLAIKRLKKMEIGLRSEIERISAKLEDVEEGKRYFGRRIEIQKLLELTEIPSVYEPNSEYIALKDIVEKLGGNLYDLDHEEHVVRMSQQ